MISKEFHASRRALYASVLNENSVGFVFSGTEKEWKGDEMYPFTPYANFYYLTGFSYPDAVLMVVKRNGVIRETLFIDHPDEKAARWTGVSYTKESVKEETGIEQVEYLERFEKSIFIRFISTFPDGSVHLLKMRPAALPAASITLILLFRFITPFRIWRGSAR